MTTTDLSTAPGTDGEGRLGAPIFVIGAPRSGTTYLQESLNHHPQIFLTNETRVMTFVNRVLHRVGANRWVLMSHRADFLHLLRREMPVLIERFYVELGAQPGVRWGDKNPHYADPHNDPECLDLIDELFPNAQFIDIVRDGRDVVASIVAKGWAELDEAIAVWRGHIEHAASFGQRIASDRYIRIRYEDLRDDGVAVMRRLMRFLRLDDSAEVEKFVEDQEEQRTPLSNPTSDLRNSAGGKVRLKSRDVERIVEELGPLLAELGYSVL